MADIVQFDVDDTSPTIRYFPFGDTFSAPNFSAGWNPVFNGASPAGISLETGNSTSSHVTSLDGASIQVQWQGIGIRLVGSTISGASVTIQLDGQTQSSNGTNTTSDLPTLYATDGLAETNHTVTLTTSLSDSIGNQFVIFEKAVISTSSPPTNTSNLNFTEQVLPNNTVSYNGAWLLNTTTSSRDSNVAGDVASVSFLGTSFIIRGAVSPNGANYSVSLDNNIISNLSAKASFIRNDSVLFYASGLDPQSVHDLRISNDGGGTLSLLADGFSSFASGSPIPQPSSASTPASASNTGATSLSSGTIAALALAGILAFILITGSLFYFLVYRPRKRRHRYLRRRRIQPAGQAENNDAVLDIGHSAISPASSFDKSPKALKNKGSTGSGFRAWKEQARGANPKELKKLGLIFRHSDSGNAKPGPSAFEEEEEWDYDDPSAKSFAFPVSSTFDSQSQSRRLDKGKGKGKKPSLWSLRSKKSSKSSSPSYNVDLPSLPKSKGSGSDNTNGRARYSYFSEFTDITYMSTPTDHSQQLSFNNPSDQTSKRPTPSPNHARTDSNGLLLIHHDRSSEGGRDANSTAPPSSYEARPEVFVHEVSSSAPSDSVNPRHSVVHSVPGISVNSDAAPSEDAIVTRDADRGSVRTYDDALSVLGVAAARAALRGLSPRTSEVSSSSPSDFEPRRPEAAQQSHPRHSLALSGESFQRERLISDETVRPDASGRFLDVRVSSPFQIDFVGQRRDSQDRKKSARLSEGSRVRFDDQTVPPSGADQDKGKGKAAERAAPPKSTFRLTPQMSLSPPANSDVGSSVQETSFLDFSGSSSASVVSHSVDTSGSSRRLSAFSGFPQAPRSRWSSTTAPSSTAPGQHSSSESNQTHQSEPSVQTSPGQSPPSYHFPYPVSLPASPHHPEGYKPSPPTQRSADLPSDSPTTHSSVGIHSHPSGLSTNPVSPAESVPMSISDLHFQHSDSDEHVEFIQPPGNSSHLPPHPPLPASVPPTPTRPQTEAAPQTVEMAVTPTTRVLFGPRSPNTPSTVRDPSTPTAHRIGPMGPRQPPR
ncbi:hypothetical protein VKT23_001208 [Stygiomarasmius scandens]|uniref:Uncharacterized protein n=1 Tax=Marasmiellus scandens TaxID=2682957 RepID=A0ABR1K6S4_9AGAR